LVVFLVNVFNSSKKQMELNPQLSNKAQYDFLLVESALTGDEKAFAKLMSRYKDAIYFMLLKMVNNKSDAEDLTLEAFGKAFKNLHQYSPSYAFSTWLFKIATNNCIDFLRKRRGVYISIENNQDNNDNDIPVKLRSADPNPEEKLIRIQKAILMRKIVFRLKPRYRILVELRYFREFSYEEIAKELNLPLGTVKAQLFRAREMLFKMIESTEIDEHEQ
jgi:RNA polymerase sigma factor (sigma-70 family)